MTVDTRLSHLADGKRLLAVEAGEIPAPPHAKHPGNHLFVNCLYHNSVNQLSSELMLAAARADTLVVLQFLRTNKMLDDIVSVCISFYADTESRNPRHRLYRYSIFTSSISHDEMAIDASYFSPSKESIQSSQREDIARLLSLRRV